MAKSDTSTVMYLNVAVQTLNVLLIRPRLEVWHVKLSTSIIIWQGGGWQTWNSTPSTGRSGLVRVTDRPFYQAQIYIISVCQTWKKKQVKIQILNIGDTASHDMFRWKQWCQNENTIYLDVYNIFQINDVSRVTFPQSTFFVCLVVPTFLFICKNSTANLCLRTLICQWVTYYP